MGIQTTEAHILSREQKSFAVLEETPGQFAEPKTADSLGLKLNFTPNVPRKNFVSSYMVSRDILERITQRSEHSWSAEGPYIPSGTKNVAPDCGDLIRAVMGTETVGANDVTWSTNSSQAIETLSIVDYYQALIMQAMAGAWAEEMTISVAGGDEPMIKFSGGGMDYACTGYTTMTGTNNIDAVSITVAADGGVNFHDPVSSSIFARSAIGIGVSASGSVTAAADGGGGTAVDMTSTAHGLTAGDTITTTDFVDANYNKAAITIDSVADADTFTITTTWGATGTGTFTTMESAAITVYADAGDSEHVVCTSASHDLGNGQSVTITGTTNYNGTFNVSSVATNTFEIVDTWVADDGVGTFRANSYHVTDRTTDTLTITPGLAKAYSSSESVYPVVPTYTVTGSPIAGITGNLSWDSADFALSQFEITVKNNHKALGDHAFAPHVDDLIPNIRDITGKFTARLRQDFIIKMLARQDFSDIALAVWTGGAAQSGTRLQIAATYCELDYSPINIPEAEEATVDFSFICKGSSGNDALTITHT